MPEYKIDEVDFFAAVNQTEQSRCDTVAYLIDDLPAYTTPCKGDYPEVTIMNPSAIVYQFVPIDHNIVIRRHNGDMERVCDGMLYYGEGRRNILFVELKDRSGKKWISDAAEQLERTISIFNSKYPPSDFGTKCAYIANRQHPRYQAKTSHRELYDKFRTQYHYRLFISGIINIG